MDARCSAAWHIPQAVANCSWPRLFFVEGMASGAAIAENCLRIGLGHHPIALAIHGCSPDADSDLEVQRLHSGGGENLGALVEDPAFAANVVSKVTALMVRGGMRIGIFVPLAVVQPQDGFTRTMLSGRPDRFVTRKVTDALVGPKSVTTVLLTESHATISLENAVVSGNRTTTG